MSLPVYLGQRILVQSSCFVMGRKKTKQTASINRDAHHRISFLLQAAHTVLAINPSNLELARFYITTMNSVSRKLVLKLDPQIKRSVCKHCQALLVPGVTSRVRVQGKRETHVVVTCLDCGKRKRFLARKNHTLWCERQEHAETGSKETLQHKEKMETTPKINMKEKLK